MMYTRRICLIALFFSAICLSAQSPFHRNSSPEGPRDAVNSRDGFFAVPMIGRNRVDRCLHWGSGCDQPAADQFCRQQGFSRAADFTTRLARPTFIMGENQTCNRSDCSALENVRCVRAEAAPRDNYPPARDNGYPPRDSRDNHDNFFAVPMIGRNRVDRCLHWGSGCDQPAADQFCRQQGFSRATDFTTRLARPTYIMGENQICNRSDCSALENVRCGGPHR